MTIPKTMKTNLNYYGGLQKTLLDNAKLVFYLLAFVFALSFTMRQLSVFSQEFAEFAQSKDSNFKHQANRLLDK